MNRNEAIKKARNLATTPVKNRNEAEKAHKQLNQLFKQYNLNWLEIE